MRSPPSFPHSFSTLLKWNRTKNALTIILLFTMDPHQILRRWEDFAVRKYPIQSSLRPINCTWLSRATPQYNAKDFLQHTAQVFRFHTNKLVQLFFAKYIIEYYNDNKLFAPFGRCG